MIIIPTFATNMLDPRIGSVTIRFVRVTPMELREASAQIAHEGGVIESYVRQPVISGMLRDLVGVDMTYPAGDLRLDHTDLIGDRRRHLIVAAYVGPRIEPNGPIPADARIDLWLLLPSWCVLGG